MREVEFEYPIASRIIPFSMDDTGLFIETVDGSVVYIMSFSSRFSSFVPSTLKPVAKAIYYRLFRMSLQMRCWYEDRFRMKTFEAPVPPAMLRFRVCESFAIDEFLRVGEGCAERIKQYANDMGVGFPHAHRVLDFGCGCGRTIRWFLRNAGNTEFYGVDVDGGAIKWCANNLRNAYFQATAPVPPLPFPDEHFDLIYCLSVFTHLNESMQNLWLPELNRILKPGGVILLTIHGEIAAQGLDSIGQQTLHSEGFVHKHSEKLKGIVPDWYHTSWHAREYIIERLEKWFGDVRYKAVPDGLQDFVMARKIDIQ